jgi:hypothetical protein
MTHWSLSHHKVKGLVVISASLLALGLTACGSSPGNTAVAGPVTTSSGHKASPKSSTPKPAPASQDDQAAASFLCRLLSQEDATSALGFNPGDGQIDHSGVVYSPDKMCGWGNPLTDSTKSFILISAAPFQTEKAAKAAFAGEKIHYHGIFTDPKFVHDESIGYGAVSFASVTPETNIANASIIVGARKWIITILYQRYGLTADQAEITSAKLAQAVVNRLP